MVHYAKQRTTHIRVKAAILTSQRANRRRGEGEGWWGTKEDKNEADLAAGGDGGGGGGGGDAFTATSCIGSSSNF